MSTLWRPRSRDHGVVEELHAEARLALIISLVAFCCPAILPAGLILGWRVRNHARQSAPDLVEWVSLPYYIASTGLWLGAALGIMAAFILAVCWHC